MRFCRADDLRPRIRHLLTSREARSRVLAASPKGDGDAAGWRTQTCSPTRIRYAAELAGAGIMIAGFLALAILG